MDAFAMSFTASLILIAFASLGAFAGLLHLALVSWQVRACLSQAHGAGAVLAVILALGRIPATTVSFALAAWHGALPLGAALAGFLVVRAILVRRPRIVMP
jgi:hypothetical protein